MFRTRRFWLLALLAVGLPWIPSLQGQDDGFGPPGLPELLGPRIRIERPDHDWGQIIQGTIYTHTFKVFNDGDKILRIMKVKPG